MADALRIGGVFIGAVVARDGLEVVVANFDADGAALVAFALQIGRDLLAQAGEHRAEFLAVAHGVQVALEGGLAAHAHRLALGHHGAVVAPPGGLMQPCAVAFAEVLQQPSGVAFGELADGLDAVGFEFFVGLGPNAVDLAAGQWPDEALQIGLVDDGNALGFVELAGHFGQEFVGRYADRAGQARGLKDAFLDQARQHPTAFALAAGHVGEVDVDLIHATVFHERRDLGDDGFEAARKVPVTLKVHRQQNGVGAQLGGLHQAHGRADAKGAGGVGGRGDHTSAGVAQQAREKGQRNVAQAIQKGLGVPFAIGVGGLQLSQQIVLAPPSTANDHRQALELRVTHELAGRVERVHVEVGDAADGSVHATG